MATGKWHITSHYSKGTANGLLSSVPHHNFSKLLSAPEWGVSFTWRTCKLETLKWLAEHGFIDMFFGFGVLTFVYQLFRRVTPSNIDELEVSADFDSKKDDLLYIQLTNSGNKNIYISKAYFKPFKVGYPFRRVEILNIKQRENLHVIGHNYYIVKFPPNLQSLDVLLKPGIPNSIKTGFSLVEKPDEKFRNKGKLGKLVFEYSLYGKNGKHIVKL